ncbi:response regulator [Alteromonas mediterranea]|uniref:response regulator n=1 Tax=Alteromonas mediterranea TaxID=314275 RepID=UPI001130473C|nr:response regulator [Alteromonas mediterranea]QDG40081.1 response regulator [Alteromonas mediterranea]
MHNQYFKLLAVDDQIDRNRLLYNNLAEPKKSITFKFDLKYSSSWECFLATDCSEYDAILLDVNLQHGWGVSLLDALKHIGHSCPIILVSYDWKEEHTIVRVDDILKQDINVDIINVLSLNNLTDWPEKIEGDVITYQLSMAFAITRFKREFK